MGAHGDHWETLYPSADQFLSEELPSLVESAEIIFRGPWKGSEGGYAFDELIVLSDKAGEVRRTVLLMRDARRDRSLLFSAYPRLVDGSEHEIEITHIEAWEHGAEGQIAGVTSDGLSVAFFDPLFFRNAPEYREG